MGGGMVKILDYLSVFRRPKGAWFDGSTGGILTRNTSGET